MAYETSYSGPTEGDSHTVTVEGLVLKGPYARDPHEALVYYHIIKYGDKDSVDTPTTLATSGDRGRVISRYMPS